MEKRVALEERMRADIRDCMDISDGDMLEIEWDLYIKIHEALCDLARYYERQGFRNFKH